jgi:hypothetical protein
MLARYRMFAGYNSFLICVTRLSVIFNSFREAAVRGT